jgi:hypothetical protein
MCTILERSLPKIIVSMHYDDIYLAIFLLIMLTLLLSKLLKDKHLD